MCYIYMLPPKVLGLAPLALREEVPRGDARPAARGLLLAAILYYVIWLYYIIVYHGMVCHVIV